LTKVYWGTDGIWSDGYFVSTVGVDEAIIQAYIENQGQKDTGQTSLSSFNTPTVRSWEVYLVTRFRTVSNACIYYGQLHTLNVSTSTIAAWQEDLITTGACGYAAVEWAVYAINRVNTGGDATSGELLNWGKEKLAFLPSGTEKTGPEKPGAGVFPLPSFSPAGIKNHRLRAGGEGIKDEDIIRRHCWQRSDRPVTPPR